MERWMVEIRMEKKHTFTCTLICTCYPSFTKKCFESLEKGIQRWWKHCKACKLTDLVLNLFKFPGTSTSWVCLQLRCVTRFSVSNNKQLTSLNQGNRWCSSCGVEFYFYFVVSKYLPFLIMFRFLIGMFRVCWFGHVLQSGGECFNGSISCVKGVFECSWTFRLLWMFLFWK